MSAKEAFVNVGVFIPPPKSIIFPSIILLFHKENHRFALNGNKLEVVRLLLGSFVTHDLCISIP